MTVGELRALLLEYHPDKDVIIWDNDRGPMGIGPVKTLTLDGTPVISAGAHLSKLENQIFKAEEDSIEYKALHDWYEHLDKEIRESEEEIRLKFGITKPAERYSIFVEGDN